jgi:DNA topoisomerase IB
MKTLDLTAAVGNPRGRNSDKDHRVAKLLRDWTGVRAKLEAMVVRGRARTDASLCAYGVLLIMETGIRVGNEESAEGFVCVNKHHELYGQEVRTYGLTTLQARHVEYFDGRLYLSFVGKKHVAQSLTTADPVLYKFAPPVGGLDENDLWLGVTDAMLRKFVKRYVGRCFTPKDIRRAFVNRLFLARFLTGGYVGQFQVAERKSDRNAIMRTCIEDVAATVGHTPGVCRSASLSHPMLEVLKQWTPDLPPFFTHG